MATTDSATTRYHTAVEQATGVMHLHSLLQQAYDAVVAAEEFWEQAVSYEFKGFSCDDDEAKRMARVLVNEMMSVNREDLIGALHAVEDLKWRLRELEQNIGFELDGKSPAS